MQLVRARLIGVGPFADVEFHFGDEEGRPRPMTVVHGCGGVGKSTLLGALANTRPGHSAVLQTTSTGTELDLEPRAEQAPHAICDWLLGQDDPARPHALCVATPSARVHSSEEPEMLRRREQALFDKLARSGGFAFLSIPSSRWFSRQPISLNAPGRSIARYDVRALGSAEDASRSDLTRDTKQALAYAAISCALAEQQGQRSSRELGDAMRTAVDRLVSLGGFSYIGLDPRSFEPMFHGITGRPVTFDLLPTRVRHLVAFGALPVRMLWGAYPGRDPRTTEAVVAIDEADLHLDAAIASGLVAALRTALPGVQWILTTSSPALANSVDARDVIALRRAPELHHIELYTGEQARTH